MDSLPTPAPSSDPPMPTSSPTKQQQHHLPHLKKATSAINGLSRPANGMPFTSLDLNVLADRAKTFQDARQKAGETPPPSSPTLCFAPRADLAVSSPSSSPPLVPGASPCKSNRVARRSNPLDARLVRGRLYPDTPPTAELPELQLGLVPNPDLTQATEVPHLLWACRTHSLIVGRCKPSSVPHASQGLQQDDSEALLEDLNQLQGVAPSTQGLGAKKVVRVNLPNEARHVSRVHAVIEWIPFVQRSPRSASQPAASGPKAGPFGSQDAADPAPGTFIVRIVGQNGLIVDGKRRREGQVLRLTPGKTVLDFFGVKSRFEAHQSTSVEATQAATPSRIEPAARGLSPIKRLSFAQLQGAREGEPSRTGLFSRADLPSSPPPTSELHFSSPSKRSAGSSRICSPSQSREQQPHPTKQQPQRAALGQGLKAGANAQRRLMVGASDDEDQNEEEEDDDDDESDDEDYVPDSASPVKKATQVRRKAVGEASNEALLTSSSISRASSPSTVAVRQQAASASSRAASRASSSEPESTKKQQTSASVDKAPQSENKRVQADQLTDSQTRMPPPPALIRASLRRSASNSPAPGSPMLGGSSSVQDWQSLARRCVRQLAPTYDLAGLLAGAIVFHRTATISASEAVRSVLTSTPGLMKGEAGERSVAFSPSRRKLPGVDTLQHGCIVPGWPLGSEGGEKWSSIARKAWREHLEVVLQSSPMFGVIHRAGKDASGNPLECWYYYDKENDPDRERAENLGVFAKPMRKAIKGQKPIFWKKSGYGSRKDDFETRLPEAGRNATAEMVTASSERVEGQGEEEESINVATASLPTSAVERPRSAGVKRRRKAADDADAEGVGSAADGDEVERKREMLRAKIARSGVWDETQPEEKEEASWDKVGDQDWGKSRK